MEGKRFGLGIAVALLLGAAPGCGQLQSTADAPAAPQSANPAPAAPQRGAGAQATGGQATGGQATGGPATGAPATGKPLTVRDVAERVRPAVVQIVTQQGVTQTDRLFGVRQRGVQEGIGSGVIYDQQGHVLTNNHVVANANQMSVALPDGRTFDGRLVGADPDTDLAVIQITADNLPVAQLGQSSQLAIGDGVVAIGNALGLPGGPTVTAGVVS